MTLKLSWMPLQALTGLIISFLLTGRKRMKSNWQLRLESQQKADQQKKEEHKAKRQEAKARKEAKLMRPRKEDVSQLADDIKLLNSSQ